ncbi:MAG: alpha-L-glutamate ligase [Gammaproteobacteria bacterium]|nr:MAG: alpha-L-glutamate ligase [Gammaproteobacteria bacterium]
MNKNIKALTKACGNLNILFENYHETNNLVSVHVGANDYVFVNWTTPLNSQSIMQLCQDKDYFYSYYRDVINMPKTSAFLNPYSDEKYKQYLHEKTVYEIINAIESHHSYPMIIKKNRGSWGANVFKVKDRRQLEKGLLDIFNMNSFLFDYICLAQDYIDIEKEYRAIFLSGELQFCYYKIIDGAIYTDNLSPLHWEGSKAKLVSDLDEKKFLSEFCAPLFDKLMIPFCGLDIARDHLGRLWLIEANSSPGFEYIIEGEGEEIAVRLYENILRTL